MLKRSKFTISIIHDSDTEISGDMMKDMIKNCPTMNSMIIETVILDHVEEFKEDEEIRTNNDS